MYVCMYVCMHLCMFVILGPVEPTNGALNSILMVSELEQRLQSEMYTAMDYQ